LIDKAITLFDDMIDKIHQIRRKRGKEDFKSLKDKLDKAIDALQKELDKLG
jgi:replicative DNA helicase